MSLLANPTDELLDERQKTHGSFVDHASCTQSLKHLLHNHPQWAILNDMQREALDMISHKIGRIMAGNPNEPDHWDDIAGYARLPVRFAEETSGDTVQV